MGMPVVTAFDQDRFNRVANDASDESATLGTTYTGNNTYSDQNADTTFRMRFTINQTVSGADTNLTLTPTLYYSYNSGAWTEVGNPTDTDAPVRVVNSANVTDGGATTLRLGGGYTEVTGAFEDTAPGAAGVTFSNPATGEATEYEWAVEIYSGFSGLANGDTIALRVQDGATALSGNYDAVPTFSATGLANNTQKTLTPSATGTASLSTVKTAAPTPPEPVEPDPPRQRLTRHRTPGGNCLFLTVATPVTADTITAGWFREAGWRVELRELTSTIPADITDFDVVYLSEEVSSAAVTAAWIECPIPLFLTESSGADNLELTDADSAASTASPSEYLRLVRQFGHKTFDAGVDLDATYPTWVNRGWANDANLSPSHIKLMEVGAGGGETSAFLVPKGGETFGRPARHTRSVMWLESTAITSAGPWMRRIMVGLLEETAWHDVPSFKDIYQSQVIVPDTGGANTKTLTPSATGTSTLSRITARFRSYAHSGVGTATLSRITARFRSYSYSGVGTATLSRITSRFRTFTFSGVGTATLATIKGFARQAAMSGVGTASLTTIKAAFRSLASLATGSATLARLTARFRTFAFSGVGTAALSTIKGAFRTLSASGVGTASLSTLKGKGVLSTFSGIGTATLTKVLGALRTLSSSATGTATLSRLLSAARSFSATGTGTAGFSRVFGAKRVLSATATGTAALSAVLGGAPDYTQSASMTGVGTASLSTVYTPAPPVVDTRPDGAAGYHGDVEEPYQRVIEEEDIEAFIRAFLRSLE